MQSKTVQHRAVNPKELKRQAKTLGIWIRAIKKSDKSPGTKKEMDQLEGIWNMLHTIVDDLEDGRECVLEDASIG